MSVRDSFAVATREAARNYCDTLLVRKDLKSFALNQISIRSDKGQAVYPGGSRKETIRRVAVGQDDIFRC